MYKNLSQDESPSGYEGLEVSPPVYVKIDGKLSPVPQISILEATILIQNKSCQLSQFSRKINIVCKIGAKNEFGGILRSHPLVLWQSEPYSTNVDVQQSQWIVRKIKSSSINLHIRDYHSLQKEFPWIILPERCAKLFTYYQGKFLIFLCACAQ